MDIIFPPIVLAWDFQKYCAKRILRNIHYLFGHPNFYITSPFFIDIILQIKKMGPQFAHFGSNFVNYAVFLFTFIFPTEWPNPLTRHTRKFTPPPIPGKRPRFDLEFDIVDVLKGLGGR